MRPKYENEMVAPHWTPKTFEAKAASYARYLSGGGTLSRLDWQTMIVAPSLEDDRASVTPTSSARIREAAFAGEPAPTRSSRA